jgi:hypothetical protein
MRVSEISRGKSWAVSPSADTELVKLKADFNANLNVDGFTILLGGLKTPLLDGLDRFSIKTETQPANNSDVTRMPGGVNDQP